MIEIIAECGINACGCTETAYNQIDIAKACGCSKVKFQLYETEYLYQDNYKSPYYLDSKRGEFSMLQLRRLSNYANEVGIEFFVSVFNPKDVILAETLGVGIYKIASRSRNDIPLIKEIQKTGKPVILSSPDLNIDKAVKELRDSGLTILYCVPKYPTEYKDVDFRIIKKLKTKYKVPVGFSDHTVGIKASVEALYKGADVIEKHITTDRHLPGCDQVCSLEMPELKLLVEIANDITLR